MEETQHSPLTIENILEKLFTDLIDICNLEYSIIKRSFDRNFYFSEFDFKRAQFYKLLHDLPSFCENNGIDLLPVKLATTYIAKYFLAEQRWDEALKFAPFLLEDTDIGLTEEERKNLKLSTNKNRKFPEACYCPFTGEIISDPVTLSDGSSFEKGAITAYLMFNDVHPITHEQLAKEQKRFYSNYALRNAIEHLKLNAKGMPAECECPISKMIMVSPCLLEDGHTYEQEEIEEWLETHNTSPKTGEQLSSKELIPNLHLQALIEDYLKQHPKLYDDELDVYLPKSYIAGFKQAVINNNLQAIQMWIAKDRRLVNMWLDDNGNTAFHHAVINKNSELAKLLIENGADTAVKDTNGFTPIECYFMYPSVEMASILADYLGKYDAKAYYELGLRFTGLQDEKATSCGKSLLKQVARLGSINAFTELYYIAKHEIADEVDIIQKLFKNSKFDDFFKWLKLLHWPLVGERFFVDLIIRSSISADDKYRLYLAYKQDGADFSWHANPEGILLLKAAVKEGHKQARKDYLALRIIWYNIYKLDSFSYIFVPAFILAYPFDVVAVAVYASYDFKRVEPQINPVIFNLVPKIINKLPDNAALLEFFIKIFFFFIIPLLLLPISIPLTLFTLAILPLMKMLGNKIIDRQLGEDKDKQFEKSSARDKTYISAIPSLELLTPNNTVSTNSDSSAVSERANYLPIWQSSPSAVSVHNPLSQPAIS